MICALIQPRCLAGVCSQCSGRRRICVDAMFHLNVGFSVKAAFQSFGKMFFGMRILWTHWTISYRHYNWKLDSTKLGHSRMECPVFSQIESGFLMHF